MEIAFSIDTWKVIMQWCNVGQDCPTPHTHASHSHTSHSHTHTHTNTHTSHSHAPTHTHHTHTQTKWEQATDKKIERNTVQRRMEGLLRKQQYSLEERREKCVTIVTFLLLFLCTKY